MLVKMNDAKKFKNQLTYYNCNLIKNSNLLLKICIKIQDIYQKYSNAFFNFNNNHIKITHTFCSRYLYIITSYRDFRYNVTI